MAQAEKSKKAKRGLSRKIDWDRLEREFILNDKHPAVEVWLREAKGWPENRIQNGNRRTHTLGWSQKRENHQQHLTEEALREVLVEQKKRIPQLLKAKLNLVAKIVEDTGNWRNLNAKDKKLIYDIVKTELGEPTHITRESPPPVTDPVEALLKEYNIIDENGKIIDAPTDTDSEARADSEEPAPADNGTPQEVA